MKRIWFLLFLIISVFLTKQTFSQQEVDPFKDIEAVFWNDDYIRLEQAIKKASQRQAIYAYNVANAATPGFKPILFDDDRQQLKAMMPAGYDHMDKVMVEYFMTKISENSKRHSAYIALWKGKIDTLKKVVTLGK